MDTHPPSPQPPQARTHTCSRPRAFLVFAGNHTAYKRWKGRKTPASEIAELWTGLKEAGLDDFDVLLSGYCPSAAIVAEVGVIARELRARRAAAAASDGKFFWVLDPVMGDNGKLYVAEDTVPAFRTLVGEADLILPNQFEAELLSGVAVRDLVSMGEAMERLHRAFGVPHVVITSVRLPATEDGMVTTMMTVIGSTATSDRRPRMFRVTIPAFPVFFSGTGDMFAALMVSRLREAAREAGVLGREHWTSDDGVRATELPLARAAERVLASMHAVLRDTAREYDKVAQGLEGQAGVEEDQRHLRLTRAAEVRVVRNVECLRHPPDVDDFKAMPVLVGGEEE